MLERLKENRFGGWGFWKLGCNDVFWWNGIGCWVKRGLVGCFWFGIWLLRFGIEGLRGGWNGIWFEVNGKEEL